MKIKVSKAFAKFINDTAKELGFEVFAKVVELSTNQYKINVDYDLFRAYDYGDFNSAKGTYKALCLSYPESYYSCGQYLSTYELNQEFKRMGVSDLIGLKKMIRELCEI